MTNTSHEQGGRGFGSALFAMVLVSHSVVADAEVFGRFENQVISEPEPIDATLSNWGDGFDEGERQWSVNHAEIGVRYNGVELSIQQRALADLRMNEAAVEYWGRISRKESLEPGTRVPVTIAVNGFTAKAARLGFRFDLSKGWLAVGGAVLQAGHLMSGELNGEFESLADADFNFNAQVDYAYYQDVIFARPDVDEASGTGWTFDLAGQWYPDDRWTFAFRADDLFAKIRWRDAPYTRAQADTNNKSYDDNGYAVFDPIFSGTEGYEDTFYQELDPRYQASVSLSGERWSTHVRGQYQFGYGMAGIGVGRRFSDGSEVRALYWPQNNSIGIEWEKGGWDLALSLDSPEWERVRALAMSISRGY